MTDLQRCASFEVGDIAADGVGVVGMDRLAGDG